MLSRLLWICLAGALGTGARYLIGVWAGERFGSTFPYGTLIVNVAGCFLIGALMQAALSSASFSPTLRLTLTRNAALTNFTLTTLACFVAVLLGVGLAQQLLGTPRPE